MNNDDFINYVLSLLNLKDSAYYDEQKQCFYFYSSHFQFRIFSDSNSASLTVKQEKHNVKYIESFALTVEQAKQFVEKMAPMTSSTNSYAEEDIKKIGTDKFNDILKTVDEYLKEYCPKNELNSIDPENLDRFKFQIPIDGVQHTCALGRILTSGRKQEQLLTSIVKIPIYFVQNNSAKPSFIAYDFIIPSWKIRDYPILEYFVTPKLFGTDFDTKFSHMIETFPSGSLFLKDFLNYTIAAPEKKSTANKI